MSAELSPAPTDDDDTYTHRGNARERLHLLYYLLIDHLVAALEQAQATGEPLSPSMHNVIRQTLKDNGIDVSVSNALFHAEQLRKSISGLPDFKRFAMKYHNED